MTNGRIFDCFIIFFSLKKFPMFFNISSFNSFSFFSLKKLIMFLIKSSFDSSYIFDLLNFFVFP